MASASATPVFYGIGDDVYVVSRSGTIWCLRSPALGVTSRRPVRCQALPVTVRRLTGRDVATLDPPSDCLE